MSFKDLTDKHFGRLTAIRRVGSRCGRALWLCRCECGKEVEVRSSELLDGNTVSCGCYSSDESRKRMNAYLESIGKTVHGESHTRLYGIWKGMKKRCYSPSNPSYENYGGRGIKVCDEWQTFPPFKEWAMASGYDPNAPFGDCTIDRIDVNGNYEPSNCRWTNLAEQGANKRPPRPHIKRNSKPVQMLSQDGSVLATFPTLSRAAKAVNGYYSNISKVCGSQTLTAYGYRWRFAIKSAC